MALRVRTKGGFVVTDGSLFAGGMLLENVADAEGTSLAIALERLGERYGVVLSAPVDALGRSVDAATDVFSAWLEHGETAGGFDTDLVLVCDAAPLGPKAGVQPASNAVAADAEDGDANLAEQGPSTEPQPAQEASSIYDLLQDS